MQNLMTKASQVKLLVMDVDGVLSNGQIIYDQNGHETKCFDVQDGFGIECLHKAGFKTAIITGRKSAMVDKRAKELNIDYYLQGRSDKLTALQEILADTDITLAECAYIGDDWVDIKALQAVGFAVAVANAHNEVIKRADMVTTRAGGHGAVRELCDLLLKATGNYEMTLAKFLSDEAAVTSTQVNDITAQDNHTAANH